MSFYSFRLNDRLGVGPRGLGVLSMLGVAVIVCVGQNVRAEAEFSAAAEAARPGYGKVGFSSGCQAGDVSSNARKACLSNSRFILDQPEISSDISVAKEAIRSNQHIKKGQKSVFGKPVRYANGDDIHCRFISPDPSEGYGDGRSSKFWCARTDQNGGLFSEDGEFDSAGNEVAVKGAVSANADGVLLSSSGAPVLDAKNKPIKGDILKVKYIEAKYIKDGKSVMQGALKSSDRRERDEAIRRLSISRISDQLDREQHIEVAITQGLFWLGLPTDLVTGARLVICDGCELEPFGKQNTYKSGSKTAYPYAGVERKFHGKKVKSGSNEKFSFGELKFSGENGKISDFEYQVYLTALSLFNFDHPIEKQNRLVCAKKVHHVESGSSGAVDEIIDGIDADGCLFPVPFVQDVGSALGSSHRGELDEYSKSRVFDGSKLATGLYKGSISSEARQELANRLCKLIPNGDATLVRTIFANSNIQLASGSIDSWTSAFITHAREVTGGNCR